MFVYQSNSKPGSQIGQTSPKARPARLVRDASSEPPHRPLVFPLNPSSNMASKKQSRKQRQAEQRDRAKGIVFKEAVSEESEVAVSSSAVDRSARRQKARAQDNAKMPFSKKNYLLLAMGVAIITVGYIIMRMENEVDGFISLNVAPLLLLFGYLEIIYAIWWRPKDVESKPTLS